MNPAKKKSCFGYDTRLYQVVRLYFLKSKKHGPPSFIGIISFEFITITGSNRSVWKLFVIDKNTW